MDSGGLGELVRCSLIVKREKGAIKLVNLTAKITDLLTITKLLTVFDTCESEQAALGSFGDAEPEQVTQLQEKSVIRAAQPRPAWVLVEGRKGAAIPGEQHRARRRLIREQPVGAERPDVLRHGAFDRRRSRD